MSLVKVKFEIMFDDNKIWRSASELQASLAQYLNVQNLNAEDIRLNKNSDVDFSFAIYLKPTMVKKADKTPVKQQVKNLKNE